MLTYDAETTPRAEAAAGSATGEFAPLEGERLEQMASTHRGPVRWAAQFVISRQAQRERTEATGDDIPSRQTDPPPPPAPVPVSTSAPAPAVRLTRSGRPPRKAPPRGAAPEVTRPAPVRTGTANARLLAARAAVRAKAEGVALPEPAATDDAGPQPIAGTQPIAGPQPAPTMAVAPISGWVPTAEDDTAWDAWVSDPTMVDTDGRLERLGATLARPTPAPIRLAERWGDRRRRDHRHPTGD